MKLISAFILAATLKSIFLMANLSAQTVAIGHVSAEIIESVSAFSNTINDFDLKSAAIQSNEIYALNDYSNENVNLGEIKINSGSNMNCQVVLKSAKISDNNGNNLIIEPFASSVSQSEVLQTVGSQTLKLKGRSQIRKDQAIGCYQGSYTMIFAYN